MKKIILILIILLFMVLMPSLDASASKIPQYVNILDMNMLDFNNETGFFCSSQTIELKEGSTYTVVASKKFFGERIQEGNELKGKFFSASYKTNSANNLTLGFSFKIAETGLHYTSVKVPENCTMTINNFLSKGYTLENFPRDEVAMYEGDISLFDGFRRNVDLTNYEKVDAVIDIYTDIDNKLNIEDLTKSIMAVDNQEGIIDISLVEDNYSNNTNLGSYLVVYEAKDSNNNVTRLNINIKVVDATNPIISGPSEIIWELGQPCITLSEIKEYFEATDNVDGDITDKIEITSSGLGSYSLLKEGKYMVVLGVKDKADNQGSTNFFLTVKDTVAPTVVVEDATYNLSESFSSLSNLAKNVYVSSYDASNNTTVSFDYGEYLDEMGFSGKYTITVTVTDFYNNTTVKTAYLTILDDISPEFYMKTDLLTTNTNKAYDIAAVKESINHKLTEQGILYDEIQLVSSNYFNNENVPGEYNVKFLYKYKDSTNYMQGIITVEEAPKTNFSFLVGGIVVVSVLIVITVVYKRKRSMI